MEMTGEYRIPAPRAQVWEALNDPEVLKACIPGCETLDMQSPTEMTAKVVAKIGPVKATFNGKVHLTDINPPESYTISGEGQGGVAGFAKGGASVHLAEDGAVTVLTYAAKAQIGGKLAQLGARLIDSTAKMMADQFFAKFSEVAAARSGAMAPPAIAAVEPAATGASLEQRVEDTVEAAIELAGDAARAVSGVAARAAEGLDRSADPVGKAAANLAGHADRALASASSTSGIPKWVWIAGGLVLVVILLKLVF
ncbi:SRPBCC family protein [Prosthecomicrobium sp. N25]|uniref:SRPBCC family protein n=1 Tax=Prosthecomicrobium sp. N25 TaxID=3129254 RepID=UPI0030784909